MPKLPRRSESEQLSRRSSVNQNILNFSSDGDINSKRNSRWWKNLSDNTRRMSLLTNSQIHPDSYKVLNTDSTSTEDQNSQWWKYLSGNEIVPSPSKVNLTGDKSTEDNTEKNLSESQSEEDDQIFTKKRLFASQEQRPQKSRYSKAFNLNSVKAIEEQNTQEEKDNFKIEMFKNQLEDDKNIESLDSKETKGSKKRRKTKSIFSKKLGKRKYSDAFKFIEPVATEESNKNKKVEIEDSADENISIPKESTVENSKKELFELNRKKKRYSQSFLNALNDEPTEQFSEKGKTEKKNNDSEDSSNNHNQTPETSKIVEKGSLFKGSFKKKNYSEAFAVSKNKVLQDSESSEEEINIEEIQTQKHASFISNRSVNVIDRKKTPQKEIRNQTENITKSATKSKTSVNLVLRSEMDDSESSEEEINIEEINTQKTPEKSINATKEKKKLFIRNTRSKKYSEAFLSQDNKENENDEHEVEETKLDPSQHVKKSQTLRKGKDDSSDEENIEEIQQKDSEDSSNNHNQIPETSKIVEKGSLFKGSFKKKNYSEAFAVSKSKVLQDEEEINVDEIQTQKHASFISNRSVNVTNRKKTPQKEIRNQTENITKSATKSKTSINLVLRSEMDESESSEEGINIEEINTQKTLQKSINATKEKKELFKRNTRSKKYSEAFLSQDNKENENDEHEVEETKLDPSQHVKKSQTLRKGKDDSSDEENIEEIQQKEAVDKNFNISQEMKKNLFQRSRKIKKSSQEFLSQDNDNKEKENDDNEVEETKLDPSQRARKNQSLNKDDDSSDGENIEVIRTQKEMKKALFKRDDTRSKKYSEVFLGPSSSKIIQEENNSHSEKENDDIDTNQVSSYHGRQDLFKLQNKSRKYSQVFEVDDRNKENNQNEPMATKENAAMQRKESFEKLKTDNIKHSQAFMELISMQKEIEEERARKAKQINIENKYLEIHTNKSVNNIVEKEIESDDTKLSSISSINIPAEIKHPLFRPKARKSLYSSRSVNKNDQSSIISDQDTQKNLEQVKIRRTRSKRFSLRSTSPADSGISKFFEESLISSTKLFINPNEDGLEGSTKKKRGRPSKLSSVAQENLEEIVNDVQKSKDNIDIQKNNNYTPKKGRSKSKSITIIPESPINASDNKIIYDNNNLERSPKSTSTIQENVANTSEKENSIVTISRKSLTGTDEKETDANKIVETEAEVRREKSNTRKSVTSRGLPDEDVSDNDMTEDKNEELDKLVKQKNIVSKIPKKMNRKDNASTGNNNKKSSIINRSKESSIKNTKILYSSDLDMSLINPENSREIPVEKPIINHALNSTSNEKQSSRFIKERNYESKESLSNIITIHSSTSRAQSSQFLGVNKNVENWLSKSFVESAQNVPENKNAEEFLTTLNLEPRKSKKLFSWRRGSKSQQSSGEDELKRKEFLLAVKDVLREKPNKRQTELPVKKITDYFNKLDKNKKLKPIPKKTNSVKKTPHPVNTARLVNGKPYYAKKLFRGKQWCTPRFYKYLQNKMKEEYDDDTINESEKIMKYMVNSVQAVIKSKKYLKEEVDNLKKELARHKIIATTYDFFCFCSDFLPAEYRDLVVPMTRLYTSEPSVPYNEKDVFKPIEY